MKPLTDQPLHRWTYQWASPHSGQVHDRRHAFHLMNRGWILVPTSILLIPRALRRRPIHHRQLWKPLQPWKFQTMFHPFHRHVSYQFRFQSRELPPKLPPIAAHSEGREEAGQPQGRTCYFWHSRHRQLLKRRPKDRIVPWWTHPLCAVKAVIAVHDLLDVFLLQQQY